MRILVLNPGSSTLKASRIVDGDIHGEPTTVEWPTGEAEADDVVRRALDDLGEADSDAVGYRVVHGGDAYRSASIVEDALLAKVEALDALAPLHNRRAAAVMRAGLARLPSLAHVACFDTAFHASLPEEAWRYPLPAEWTEPRAIRRYGFHGLSVAWSVARAGELLGRPTDALRLVVAHLGSGCSVTAVDGGRSVDTSMGYTPFEGLMMGTRSGSIDPGILLGLADDGVSPADLADGLAHRSGLLAIGGAADIRELEDRSDTGDAAATLALGMFERRAASAIAAAATTLPSLDAVVFTGGIGEHAARTRGRIVRRLAVIGVRHASADIDGDAVLDPGPPAVLAVAAREDLVIAREVTRLLRDQRPRGR
ncbi:MAG TPA: acetate/propionate family kinase [Candidatus Limnocylindria bacterium]|nr:acetate/propionate family kinase [Candidatus Limnocylindria bacterium]